MGKAVSCVDTSNLAYWIKQDFKMLQNVGGILVLLAQMQSKNDLKEIDV